MRKLIFARRVSGLSMAPNLRPGKIVIASGLLKHKKGDVIIIDRGDIEIIKRVERMDDDTYYVLGDNPELSDDSRKFGWIEKRQVIGKIVWPVVKKPNYY